jgi:copper chaperone
VTRRQDDSEEDPVQHLTLHIDGMSCGHCLNAVNRALAGLPGVEVESVRIGRAELRYDERTLDASRIEAAVADAGYRATGSP